MINWTIELPKINAAAARFRVDPLFIRVIREVENGPPGLEFGVESKKGGSYEDQLEEACATVRNHLATYHGNPFVMEWIKDKAVHVLRLSELWITTFAATWAPVGAQNDPHGLNRNWGPNAIAAYDKLLGLQE